MALNSPVRKMGRFEKLKNRDASNVNAKISFFIINKENYQHMPTHLPFHPIPCAPLNPTQHQTDPARLLPLYPCLHPIQSAKNLDGDDFNLDIALLVVALAVLVEAAKLAQQRDLLGVLAAVHGQDEREDLVRLPVPIELLVEAVGEGVEIDAAVVVLEQVVALSENVRRIQTSEEGDDSGDREGGAELGVVLVEVEVVVFEGGKVVQVQEVGGEGAGAELLLDEELGYFSEDLVYVDVVEVELIAV